MIIIANCLNKHSTHLIQLSHRGLFCKLGRIVMSPFLVMVPLVALAVDLTLPVALH